MNRVRGPGISGLSFMQYRKEKEKNMKKKVLAIVLTAATVLSLTACGKFTCGICGEEKSGKKHTESVLGVELTICNDCYKEIEDAAKSLGL